MKTEVIPFKTFMNGTWKDRKVTGNKTIGLTLYSVNGLLFAVLADPVMASSDGTFQHVWEAVMKMFDYGVVLVLAFAGACWGLGHRGKAIELTISCACGYILARHAVDIRDFLKGI